MNLVSCLAESPYLLSLESPSMWRRSKEPLRQNSFRICKRSTLMKCWRSGSVTRTSTLSAALRNFRSLSRHPDPWILMVYARKLYFKKKTRVCIIIVLCLLDMRLPPKKIINAHISDFSGDVSISGGWACPRRTSMW